MTSVIPWDEMSPEDQAFHLVECHGFGADYFDYAPLTYPDNKAVRWAFVHGPDLSDILMDSFPYPDDRSGWHSSDDHDGLAPIEHDHAKAVKPRE